MLSHCISLAILCMSNTVHSYYLLNDHIDMKLSQLHYHCLFTEGKSASQCCTQQQCNLHKTHENQKQMANCHPQFNYLNWKSKHRKCHQSERKNVFSNHTFSFSHFLEKAITPQSPIHSSSKFNRVKSAVE